MVLYVKQTKNCCDMYARRLNLQLFLNKPYGVQIKAVEAKDLDHGLHSIFIIM